MAVMNGLAAIGSSIFVSGGFFAMAHSRPLRVILYMGAFLLAVTALAVGIGLIRSR